MNGRCYDCRHCDPLHLIGQTAICRKRRAEGLPHRVGSPYQVIDCPDFSDRIMAETPASGEAAGVEVPWAALGERATDVRAPDAGV